MKIVHTVNAVYKYDEPGKRIMRLTGSSELPGGVRWGIDNEWEGFKLCGEPIPGHHWYFLWEDEVPTRTAPVVAVYEIVELPVITQEHLEHAAGSLAILANVDPSAIVSPVAVEPR